MDDALYNFYKSPQTGGSAVFAGSKRHTVGGGFFGTLLRGAIPLLKSIGRRALGTVSQGATNYLSGKSEFLPAMVSEIGNEAMNFLQPSDTPSPTLSNESGRKRKKNTINKKRTIF